MWYHRVIGGERCPIVDTWWQTETGAILISPLPGATATKPGSCTQPLPGIDADIVDDHGKPVHERRRRRLSRHQEALAVDVAHHLAATTTATLHDLLGEVQTTATTSPATVRIATRTATSGSWAASTTC